jgi:putative tryptophan/tyrosine transport system substrate-binding protein
MQLDQLKRREFIALVGGAVGWPLAARAQQVDPLRRIGVLMAYNENAAFAALHRERPDALFCSNNPLSLIFRKEIADFAARERFPAAYPFAEVAEAGGLMSYGASRVDLFRRAAGFAANILNGAKPGDMPIEQPSRFELVINLKTAKALGIEVPPALIALADNVIE